MYVIHQSHQNEFQDSQKIQNFDVSGILIGQSPRIVCFDWSISLKILLWVSILENEIKFRILTKLRVAS